MHIHSFIGTKSKAALISHNQGVPWESQVSLGIFHFLAFLRFYPFIPYNMDAFITFLMLWQNPNQYDLKEETFILAPSLEGKQGVINGTGEHAARSQEAEKGTA